MNPVKKITLVVKKSYTVIVFLTIALLAYLTIKQFKNYEIRRFYKQIDKASHLLEKWKEHTSNLKFDEFLIFFQKKDVSVWVYSRDELIGWTNNKYPEPDGKFFRNSDGTSLAFVSNGWYLLKQWSKADTTYLIQLPIYIHYAFRNDYIQSHFSSFFNGVKHLRLLSPDVTYENDCLLLEKYGVCLPYVYDAKLSEHDSLQWIMPLLLYGLIFFLFVWARKLFEKNFNKQILKVLLVMTSTLLIWLGLYLIYRIPVWNSLLIKQPNFFAWSIRIPSLADLLNILTAILWFIGLTFRQSKSFPWPFEKKWSQYIIVFVFWFFLWLLLTLYYSSLPVFFLNSNWYWNFRDLTTFDPMQIWLFVPVLLTSTLLAFFAYHGWVLFQRISIEKRVVFLLWFTSGLITYLFLMSTIHWLDYIILGSVMIFIYFLIPTVKFDRLRKTLLLLLGLLLFSFVTVLALRSVYHEKLKQNLKILSLYLGSGRDHLAEYLLDETLRELKLKTDSVKNQRDSIQEYVYPFFKKGYLSNFSTQIIVCSSKDKILIRPFNEECNCWSYFNNKIDSNGLPVKAGIYFFSESNRGYYLVNFPVYQGTDTLQVFVELLPLMLEKTQDYPNLLVDRNSDVMVIPSFISYGVYNKNELTYSKGQFIFPFSMDSAVLQAKPETFIETNSHYLFKIATDRDSELVLVGEKMGFNSMWTAFSFVFLLNIFYVIVLFVFFSGFTLFSVRDKGLSSRFQRILLWLILLSFTISVFFSVQNILRVSHRKNQELLHEKGQNLKMELESLLAADSSLFNHDWLTSFVINFGYRNYLDINIYDKDGKLLSTTRPEIYERNLLSPLINPEVLSVIKHNLSPYIIKREKIEKLGYYSAYYPIYNRNYQLMGFLHVPYFTREQQFNEELFSYISSMINLYLIIIFSGIVLAYVLTAPVLRPLNLIKNRMRSIRLSGVNEKIDWEGKDEIAELIESYNNMVDELALKAKQLAENERELAWREMARQVAHEIKNPLTPMKLSTQYIWKLWLDKDKDFPQKFESYIKTIQKQIDSLDNIASSFSSLGKLINPDFTQKTSLHDLINDIRILFLSEEYDLFVQTPDEECWIVGDYQHWRQVLINLMKNAVQALTEFRRGEISLVVTNQDKKVSITVQDNGRGMTEEEKSRIFMPNFTTKTSGSGLGLAIVKTIVEMYGGAITFESEQNKGSRFTILLKKQV